MRVPKHLRETGGRLATLVVLGSAIACILQSSVAAAPNTWIKVFTDNENKNWFVDNGSIKRQGNIRYFWLYINDAAGRPLFPTINRPGQSNQQVPYGMSMYMSADCQKKLVRLRHVQLLDEKSNVITQGNLGDKGPLSAANQDALDRNVMKYVCSRR